MFKKRQAEENVADPISAFTPNLQSAAAPPADGHPSTDAPPHAPAPNAFVANPLANKDTAPVSARPLMPTPPTYTPPSRPGIALGASHANLSDKSEASDRRTLVVGRGISVQGTVQDAERLVVEGMVEASMIHAAELVVTQGGVFRGEIEVKDAELAGTIDGTLTVRGNLTVRASGRLIGKIKCRCLQVEEGGEISGHLEMITDTLKRPYAPDGTPQKASTNIGETASAS